MINIKIHFIPNNINLPCSIDENKSFGDLKNELIKRYKEKMRMFYFVMNNNVMNEDMILEDNGVVDGALINYVRNDYIIIDIRIKDSQGNTKPLLQYMLPSCFKVVKADKNKKINV